MAQRATRHNGRAGKNGVYNPKHNDRDFDVNNSDHIDAERFRQNIMWNCYHGLYKVEDEEDDETKRFERIERTYYYEHYQKHIEEQNRRNVKNGHAERNRTVDDVLKNSKTCPEETLLQIGNMQQAVTAEQLALIALDYFK